MTATAAEQEGTKSPTAEIRAAMTRIFTPRAVETIRKLAGQGKSASEIAALIGSTAGSVRVRCSQLKIKLRRGRPGLPPTRLRRIRKKELIVQMRPAVYNAFARKARDRQTSAAELAKALLEAIVSSNIYEAVLDENE